MTRIGRVPVRGELVPGPGMFEFEVLDADPRRIKKIRIYRRKKPREAAPRAAQGAASAAASPTGSASEIRAAAPQTDETT